MSRKRRSLFWTIAGMLLLTIVLGTLAQALVAVAVLRPLEARDARARAEIAASGIAAGIAALPKPTDPQALDTLLVREWSVVGLRHASILYRPREGGLRVAPPGRLPFFTRRDSAPPAPGPSPSAPRGAAEAGHPPRSEGRIEILARRAVVREQAVIGEVQVVWPVRPHGGFDLLRPPTPLLFLPIALVASLVAGLVMVRLLVRRLRGIETLVARVAEGDLTVRIADSSGDEIGQLAERLDRMTERLAQARAQIETTESQRRQLFADITHELATPLTSIRGYAETLLDPHVPMSAEERTRYVHGVLEESRRLGRLIRDLFELARLEAGASPLEREPLDWAALCRNTVERFAPRFRDAGLQLIWRGTDAEAWIEADGHRLEEVLENLLANALRYVPSGGTVALSLGAAPGGAGFRLVVGDDGPGLAPDELPLVFDRFYRGAGVGRDVGGSGLGLAIVREIVGRHGGTVRAEANEPRGLRVFVELPARA